MEYILSLQKKVVLHHSSYFFLRVTALILFTTALKADLHERADDKRHFGTLSEITWEMLKGTVSDYDTAAALREQ